jgi:ATP-dependent Clp protease ATP-binding subunit ClpA
MRVFPRSRKPEPRATDLRPAEPYLFAGAEEARRLEHDFVGTEHLLLVLIRNLDGGATSILDRLGVAPDDVEKALAPCVAACAPRIDADALAALGIDFDAVRERVEETFGPGALERTRTGCLAVTPRTKRALAYAVDYADGRAFGDEHVLLGMLAVPDSLAAVALRKLGVTQRAAEGIAGLDAA